MPRHKTEKEDGSTQAAVASEGLGVRRGVVSRRFNLVRNGHTVTYLTGATVLADREEYASLTAAHAPVTWEKE